MDITNCRRILVVGKPDCGLLDLLKGLTGTAPEATNDTIAGLSHEWNITTQYYKATVPIWLDEIQDAPKWSEEFLKPEAREVLSVLGAFVICFRKPIDQSGLDSIKELMESVQEVVKEGCGFTWDGVCLAVGMPQSTTPYLEKSHEDWEDLCQDCGFEFIDFEAVGRNEYGEPMGKVRLKEALEANDWEGIDPDDNFDLDALDEDDEGSTGFGMEATELEMEMFGMKNAIRDGTEEKEEATSEPVVEKEEDVDQLEAMMLRLQAVRDMGADMPEKDRRKFAAKAVNDLLKTM